MCYLFGRLAVALIIDAVIEEALLLGLLPLVLVITCVLIYAHIH